MSIPTPRKRERMVTGPVRHSTLDLSPKPLRAEPKKALYHFAVPFYNLRSVVVAGSHGEARQEVMKRFARINFGGHPLTLTKVVPIQQ